MEVLVGAPVTLAHVCSFDCCRTTPHESAIEESAPPKLSDVVLDTRIRKATHSSTLLRNALLRDACCVITLADCEGRDLPEQKERT